MLPTPTQDTTLTAVFSIVVAVEHDRIYKTVAAPNPVTDGVRTVEVTMPSERMQVVTVSIVDMLSRESARMSHALHPGHNTIVVPVDHLTNGMYSVILQSEKQRATIRLLVTR